MSKARKTAIVLCLVVFLVSGWMVGRYYIGNIVEDRELTGMEPSGSDAGSRMEKLYEENDDFVGWLKIPGTSVNYPVMQSDKEEPEYYLYRDFRKEPSEIGVPFADVGSDTEKSRNILIYGHNIKSGQVFHDLLGYEEKSFWKEHRTFTFNSVDHGKRRYEVVAAAYTRIYPQGSGAFKYYDYAYIGDKDTYKEYVNGVLDMACYDTGIRPGYGQKLITLSTCAYHTENGRFIVLARELSKR